MQGFSKTLKLLQGFLQCKTLVNADSEITLQKSGDNFYFALFFTEKRKKIPQYILYGFLLQQMEICQNLQNDYQFLLKYLLKASADLIFYRIKVD